MKQKKRPVNCWDQNLFFTCLNSFKVKKVLLHLAIPSWSFSYFHKVLFIYMAGVWKSMLRFILHQSGCFSFTKTTNGVPRIEHVSLKSDIDFLLKTEHIFNKALCCLAYLQCCCCSLIREVCYKFPKKYLWSCLICPNWLNRWRFVRSDGHVFEVTCTFGFVKVLYKLTSCSFNQNPSKITFEKVNF